MRTLDRYRAASVLAEQATIGTAKAAKRAGIGLTTLKRWREALASDPELSGLYEEALQARTGLWRRELREVAVQSARALAMAQDKLTDALERLGDEDPAQMVHLASQAMNDILKVLTSSTGVLVEYEALCGEPRIKSDQAPAPAGPASQGPPTEH